MAVGYENIWTITAKDKIETIGLDENKNYYLYYKSFGEKFKYATFSGEKV